MSEVKTRKLTDGRTVATHCNDGLRKRCGCPRRKWSKCPHDWHFNFKYGDQKPYRFSLDRYLGKHPETREEAEGHADRIRTEIRAGTFTLKPKPREAAQPILTTADALTLAQYGAIWHKNCPVLTGKNRGKARGMEDRWRLNTLEGLPGADGQLLGPRVIGSITQADLESAFAALRADNYAASTRNKILTLIDLLSWWGLKKGYLTRAWRSKDDESEICRERGAKRDRRVEADEEQRVFQQATPFLQRLMIAALETCCREDEILSVQWRDMSLARQEFTVQPEDAKTGKARTLPMSIRFKALVDLLRYDPAGNEHPGAAYVFGDAIGGKVSFPRKAWETAVLKAHGHVPTWTRTNGLDAASRAALKAIDLHFHDLRHEGASRLLEAGWPLHHISTHAGTRQFGADG